MTIFWIQLHSHLPLDHVSQVSQVSVETSGLIQQDESNSQCERAGRSLLAVLPSVWEVLEKCTRFCCSEPFSWVAQKTLLISLIIFIRAAHSSRPLIQILYQEALFSSKSLKERIGCEPTIEDLPPCGTCAAGKAPSDDHLSCQNCTAGW